MSASADYRPSEAGPHSRSLSLDQLAGYTEDRKSAQAFARRFLPGSVLTLLLCASAVLSLLLDHWSPVIAVLFIAGIAVGWITVIRARRAIPVSRISGTPMVRYLRADSSERHEEFIYVDEASRTYFIRRVAVSDE